MARRYTINPKRIISISVDELCVNQLHYLAKHLGGSSGVSGAIRCAVARMYDEERKVAAR
jgi:hypothetical protein